MVAANCASVDTLTMFLLPPKNVNPQGVQRTEFDKDYCKHYQAWLRKYVDRCEWLLEAYGLEWDKPQHNVIATQFPGLADDLNMTEHKHSDLQRTMRIMEQDVRTARAWLDEFQKQSESDSDGEVEYGHESDRQSQTSPPVALAYGEGAWGARFAAC